MLNNNKDKSFSAFVIQSTNINLLMNARPCSKHGRVMSETDMVPSFLELTLEAGR